MNISAWLIEAYESANRKYYKLILNHPKLMAWDRWIMDNHTEELVKVLNHVIKPASQVAPNGVSQFLDVYEAIIDVYERDNFVMNNNIDLSSKEAFASSIKTYIEKTESIT